MKRITAALSACLLWGSLLAPSSPATEIFEVLAPPVAPADDDAPSPSDLPALTPETYFGCDGAHEHDVLDCGCRPTWSFTFGALFLHRSSPSSAPLIASEAGPGGVTLLDAAQFDFSTNWGFETSAIRRGVFGTAWDVEGRYFGVNQWSAAVGPIGGDDGASILYATPWTNSSAAQINATYVSQLNSFELNGRRDWNERLQWLIGVRHIELDERGLSIDQQFDGGSELHQIGALNQLWGFQLGLDAQLLSRGRFDVGTFAKAGLYGNAADNSAVITQSAGPTFASQGSGQGAAFVGELGVAGLYRLTERWSLRATYQMLWLDGVATATNQVAVSDPVNGAATVDRRGDVFYHGGFLGTQFNW